MEGQIDPTRINQAPVDTGQELTPDGNPIQQAAAPQADRQNAQQSQQQQVEPTAEPVVEPVVEKVKEEPVIDFTQFLKAKSNVEEVEPEVKPEPKKEETTLKVVPQPDKENQQTKVTVTPSPTQRDYTGFDDEEAKLLRSMSNESFNRFKPILLEHKKIAKEVEELRKTKVELDEIKTKGPRIPESIYEHEQAFVLNPEFVSQSQLTNASALILDHWQNQLDKVEEGAAQFNMIGFDNNGNLIETQKVNAGPEAKETLREYIKHAQHQHINEQAKLNVMIQGHSAKHQEAKAWLNNFQSQAFAIFDKPDSKPVLEPMLKNGLDMLHAAYRTNPLAVPLVKALITIGHFAKQLEAASKGQGQQQQQVQPKVSQQRRAGPTQADTGGGGGGGASGNGKAEVTFDDFERAKQGY